MAYHPTSGLVAEKWVSNLPGFTPNMVASILPDDVSQWAATGFVMVTVVPGGRPDIDLKVRRPLLQLDCFWVKPGGARPQWGKASNLAENIIAHTFEPGDRFVDVQPKPGFYEARIQAVNLAGEPGRIESDDKSFARIRFDLYIEWLELPRVVP